MTSSKNVFDAFCVVLRHYRQSALLLPSAGVFLICSAEHGQVPKGSTSLPYGSLALLSAGECLFVLPCDFLCLVVREFPSCGKWQNVALQV